MRNPIDAIRDWIRRGAEICADAGVPITPKLILLDWKHDFLMDNPKWLGRCVVTEEKMDIDWPEVTCQREFLDWQLANGKLSDDAHRRLVEAWGEMTKARRLAELN